MNKCPHCNQGFTRVAIGNIPAQNLKGSWNAISYNCPNCSASLGVEIDPLAVRTEIVAYITEEFRKLK